ncbi:restriction endonuclease subunit S [Lysinibacillus pakistanensis]|uniref:restriction endonuclease subunit S n=1 Tax=Lysinibacillus pakistanensis TaxID=759811 RepID=UPI003D2E294F
MPTYKLKDLVTEVISGEWGEELSEGIEGTKIIRTTNFSNTGKLDLNKEVVFRNIASDKVEKKRLLIGDTIIEKSGGSPDQPVGRVVYFEEDNLYLCNNFTSVLRPNGELVVPKYFMYLMFNLHRTRKVKKFQNKTTGIINLKLDQYLSQTIVFIPEKEVQQKVVKVLDKTFDLIIKRQSQITALEELTQSLFLGMFGDDKTNDKNYKKRYLQDIAHVGSSKRVFVDELVNEGIPFFRGTEIGELAEGKAIAPELFITTEHYEKLKESSGVPKVGDLLMPSICPDGRIWMIEDNSPFYFKDGRVLWVSFKEMTVNPLYIQFALKVKLIKDYLKIASGTTFAELKIFTLKNVELVIPPMELQNDFAEKLLAVNKQKEKIKKSLLEMESLYNTLLQKAFKGELFQD